MFFPLARLFAPAALLSMASLALAAEWPQYRGPNHDGATADKIETQWPAAGPKIDWTIPIGSSLGSFVVEGDKAFLFEMRGEKETCVALDPKTGHERWATDIDDTIHDKDGGDGPRSTPAFNAGKVYVLGTYKKLACLNADDGKVVWRHDLMAEFHGAQLAWGSAASPVIDGDLLFVCAGGKGESLIAFNKNTGDVAWKGENDGPTHASPVPATLLGARQIIFFTQSGLVSVKPESGEVLWRASFPYNVSTAASPVACGQDIVYCSAGYGSGTAAFRISKSGDGFNAAQLWMKHSRYLVNHWSTPVYKDGFLYGLYGFKEFKTEPLKCVDVLTGKEKWSQSGFGQGQVLLVDGNLLIQGDQGQLVLTKADPDAYHEIARCQPIAGKCWTEPAVAEGHVYVRSQTGGARLDLSPR